MAVNIIEQQGSYNGSGSTILQGSTEIYYVNLNNDYKPELCAKLAASDGRPPTYQIGMTTFISTNYTIINSDSQAKMVYFPPFESSLGAGDFGRTPQTALNWHQFLAHLRFKKHKFPRPGSDSQTPIITTVVYKLYGNRVLVDEYEHIVGNDEFGYDIPIGFDPMGQSPMEWNPSYIWEDNLENTKNKTCALPTIVITSTTQQPWSLQFNDLNGLSLRFLSFGNNIKIANGMIQTIDGEALDVNSDIIFEELVYDEINGKWFSINDAHYGYSFGGLVEDGTTINNHPGGYDIYWGLFFAWATFREFVFDNMWISSSGYIGVYGNRTFIFANSSVRADYTFSTHKSDRLGIHFYNCIVVSRDDAFENLASTNNTLLKPFVIDGCVLCWKSANGGDPSNAYVNWLGTNQFGYGRGLFVNDVQEYPIDASPPASVFTSAVSELAIDLDRISYLHSDFSGITLSAGNMTQTQIDRMLGTAWNNGHVQGSRVVNYTENSPYDITYIATKATPDIPRRTWLVSVDDPKYLGPYNDSFPIENVWYSLSDVINSKTTYPVTRDGIGALYFPTFKPYSYSMAIDSDEGDVDQTVNVSIGDGSEIDFVNTYKPSSYDWKFSRVDSYNIEEISTNNPTEMTIDEGGKYTVTCGVVSNRGFYTCKSGSLSYICPADPSFDIVVVDGDGIVPDTYYAGRQYFFSATNTSIDSTKTIYKFVVEYGNNTPYNSSNGNSVRLVYDDSNTNANIGSFGTSGNSLVDSVIFNDVYGWTTLAGLVFGYDGSYAVEKVKCFVGKKEDVYYVDLSKEYEASKPIIAETYFKDTFESGSLDDDWGAAFKSTFVVKNIWGDDNVAVTSTPGYTKLFNSKISSNFDISFSFVRGDSLKDPTFKVVDSYGKSVVVEWNYLKRTLYIYGGESSILVDLHGYPVDLRCSNSLRHLDIRIRCDGSRVYSSYKLLDGNWSSETFVGYLSDYVDMYVDAKPNAGFGYFYGTADYGFGIVNGQDADYALTFTEFRNKLNGGANLYDKYLCRGYRVVSSDQSIKVSKNVTIDSWNSIADPITYGPWVLVFNDKTTNIDFTNTTMKNGIMYNLNGLARLYVGTTYDMFIVWKGEITQKYRQWMGSRYQTSNLIGSTINRIV